MHVYVYSYGVFVCVKVLAFDETYFFSRSFWKKYRKMLDPVWIVIKALKCNTLKRSKHRHFKEVNSLTFFMFNLNKTFVSSKK